MAFRILIDSGSDICRPEAKAMGLELLYLKTFFGETEFLDTEDPYQLAFFEKMKEEKVFPTTSQINPFEYEEKFDKIVSAGDECLCLTISSKISGCYQSAMTAAREFGDKVRVVDTLNACLGERVLGELALRLRSEGHSMNGTAKVLEVQKKRVRLLGVLDTLEYMKRGGRISSAAAFAGTLLNIKPVLWMDNGKIELIGKARGNKAGCAKLREVIEKDGGIDFNMPFGLASCGDNDKLLMEYVKGSEELYKNRTDALHFHGIGSIIGTHIGPGACALGYFAGGNKY